MTDADPNPLLRYPLREDTQKERLYLLGISMVGITIDFTGLIPSEISTLGITFDTANQTALLYILAVMILYFLIAFLTDAAADFAVWRLTIREDFVERVQKREKKRLEGERRRDEEWVRLRDEMRSQIEQVTPWHDAYDEVFDLGKQAIREAQTSPIHSFDDYLVERWGGIIWGESRGVEAAGCIAWLRKRGRDSAASEAESTIKQVLQWVRRGELVPFESPERVYEEQMREMKVPLLPPQEAVAVRPSPYLQGPIIIARSVFAFLLPPVVGVFAIIVLVF